MDWMVSRYKAPIYSSPLIATTSLICERSTIRRTPHECRKIALLQVSFCVELHNRNSECVGDRYSGLRRPDSYSPVQLLWHLASDHPTVSCFWISVLIIGAYKRYVCKHS
ncbi:unnamed protein product [Pieris brassicae]|uniref:Uncharacterized protein n=1 Tax=Pieris brassicae TaxID=7116 RepID=A0A9P0TXA2_PIEBR|nr:unnamed protein product [Pieris brassicae]